MTTFHAVLSFVGEDYALHGVFSKQDDGKALAAELEREGHIGVCGVEWSLDQLAEFIASKRLGAIHETALRIEKLLLAFLGNPSDDERPKESATKEMIRQRLFAS